MCQTAGVMTTVELFAALSDGIPYHKFIHGINKAWADRLGIDMYEAQSLMPAEKDGWCVFRTGEGLCELHGKSYKPFECRMAIHPTKSANLADSIKIMKSNQAFKDAMRLIFNQWKPLIKEINHGKD